MLHHRMRRNRKECNQHIAVRRCLLDKLELTWNAKQIQTTFVLIGGCDGDRWYEHVLRRPPENPVQRAMAVNIQRQPRRGRPTDTWVAQMTRLQHQQQQQRVGSQRSLRSRGVHPPAEQQRCSKRRS